MYRHKDGSSKVGASESGASFCSGDVAFGNLAFVRSAEPESTDWTYVRIGFARAVVIILCTAKECLMDVQMGVLEQRAEPACYRHQPHPPEYF